jgi:hypothetical protein
MTTNHQKMGVEPIPKMLCVSNIPQTMDSVQHSIPVVNQSLPQTFRELPCYTLCLTEWALPFGKFFSKA